MPIREIKPAVPSPIPQTPGVICEKNPKEKDSYIDVARTDPHRRLHQMILGSGGDLPPATPAAASPQWIPLDRAKFDAMEPAHDWDFPLERGKEFDSIQTLDEFLGQSGIPLSLNEKSLGQIIAEEKKIDEPHAKVIVDYLKNAKQYPPLENPKTPLDLSVFAAQFTQQHSSAHQEIKYYERLLSLERHFVVTGSKERHSIKIGNAVKKIFWDRMEEVRKSVYENYLKIAAALNKLDPAGDSDEEQIFISELFLVTRITDPLLALQNFIEGKHLNEQRSEVGKKLEPDAVQKNHKKFAMHVREELKREWFVPAQAASVAAAAAVAAAVAAAPAMATEEGIQFPAAMYSEAERKAIVQYKKFFMPHVLTDLQLQRSELQKDWEKSPKWKDFDEGLKKKQKEILKHVHEMLVQIEAGKEKFIPDLKVLEQTPEAFAQAAVDHLVQETKLKEKAPEEAVPPKSIEELRAELAAAEQKLKDETTGIEKIKLQLQINDLKKSIATLAGKEAPAEVADKAPPPPPPSAEPAAQEPPAVAAAPAAPSPPPPPSAEPAPPPEPETPPPPTATPPPAEEREPEFAEADRVPDEEPSSTDSSWRRLPWLGFSARGGLLLGSQSHIISPPSPLTLDNRVFSEEARKYHERAVQDLGGGPREETSIFAGPLASATFSLHPLAPLRKYPRTVSLLGNGTAGYLSGEGGSWLVQGQLGAGLRLGELLKIPPMFDLSGHLFFGRAEYYRGAGNNNNSWGIFQYGGCLSVKNVLTCVDRTRANDLALWMISVGYQIF